MLLLASHEKQVETRTFQSSGVGNELDAQNLPNHVC